MKKIKEYTDGIANVCTIFAFLTTKIEYLKTVPYISGIIDFVVTYRSIFIILFITIAILRYIVYVIPRIEVKIKEKPETETRASIFWVAVTLLISGILMVYSFINLDNRTIPSKADSDVNTENEEDLIMEEAIVIAEDINILTEEDKIIEMYIKMGHDEIIPKETLRTLSYNELYYIRNGMLAYAGLYFDSGYYEKFSWYHPKIFSTDEIWGEINSYQYQNILNIKEIENM